MLYRIQKYVLFLQHIFFVTISLESAPFCRYLILQGKGSPKKKKRFFLRASIKAVPPPLPSLISVEFNFCYKIAANGFLQFFFFTQFLLLK